MKTLANYGEDPQQLADGAQSLALGTSEVFFALNRKDGKGTKGRPAGLQLVQRAVARRLAP